MDKDSLRHGDFQVRRWPLPPAVPDGLPEFLEDTLPFWGHKETSRGIGKSCLSQWYPSPFQADGQHYSCMEQYMMAMKAELFGDNEIKALILAASEPGKIKALGRKVRGFDESVWERFRFSIVCTGNYQKFSENEALRWFLLGTKEAVLIEASPYDRLWGVGMGAQNPDIAYPGRWRGKNLLGFALMAVRSALRQAQE